MNLIHVVLFIIVMLCSIVFHELGHLILIRKYGGSPELRFKRGDFSAKIPEGISKKQEQSIIVAGVLAGFVPLAWGLFALDPLLSLSGFVLYVVGCKHDLIELRGNE